jgi:CO/xanthine dehydrogenase Mo-binding subunit
MLAVLELAASRAGWDQPLQPAAGAHGTPGTRYGRGIAVYPYMHGNSYCAQVVEVAVTGTELRVLRVVVAADCGRVIDPDGVRKQMEGGVVWGLSAALHGGVRIEEGQVRNSNFHDNPVLRMRECPPIEVHLVDDPGPRPWGTGELSTPVVVPALLNAVFAATGKRIRTLPVAAADLA